MNLYTTCRSCKENINIKSDATSRADLQMEKGDELKVNCQKCGKIDKIHVNDIKAESSKIIIFIGLMLGIFVTVFLIYFYGVIGTVSAIIPLFFWQQQMKSARTFNSYMIRRK